MNRTLKSRILKRIGKTWRDGIALARGKRVVKSLGYTFELAPKSQISHEKYLSKQSYREQVVSYTDMVQWHACVAYLVELNHAPVFIDIGAYHGVYAITLGKIIANKHGVVHAFEPDPDSFKVLVENVNRNELANVVRCHNLAVMDYESKAGFRSNGSQGQVCDDPSVSQIQVTTLAAFLVSQQIDRVDLLMVDVEGAELPVLKGIPFSQIPMDRIFCEMHPYAWKQFNYSATDMDRFLESIGFRCVDMYLREIDRFELDPVLPEYVGPTLLIRE